MGEIIEIMIVDRRQQHHARSLDNLVLKAWFADRSLLASLLIDPHTFNRRCLIAVASQPVVKITQVVFKVFGVVLCRHPVHAGGAVFAGAVYASNKKS